MFDVLRSRKVMLFILGFTLAPFTLAATVSQEREKLDNLQQTLRIQQQKLAEVESEAQEYPDKIADVQAAMQNEQAELDKLSGELTQLKTADAASNVDNSREINLKEHAVRMAERGVKREQRSLERLQRYQDNLNNDATTIRGTIARLDNQIARQQRLVTDLEAQTQGAPVAPPAAAPARVAKVDPAPAVNVPPPKPAPAQSPVLSQDEYDAFLVAKEVSEKLAGLTMEEDKSPIEMEGSDISDTSLNYVGGKHYRGEAAVVAGKQTIEVGRNNRFRIDIPDGDDGETYVFVADNTSRRQMQVSYFKKSLLGYIGQNPVVAKDKSSVASAPAAEEGMTRVTLPSGDTVEMTEQDAYAFEIAREQVELLADLQQEEVPVQPHFTDLKLTGNRLDSDVTFEHLFQNQYRAETRVESGRQVIRVDGKRYRIDVPDEDDGETYVFYVDATDSLRPQITFFKKSLLAHLPNGL